MAIARIRGFHLPIIACVLVAFLGLSPKEQQAAPAVQSEAGSIDALLGNFYKSLSFPEGQHPDWVLFRDLFASPQSPCVRIAGDSVTQMDRESFIAFFSGRIQRGTLKSFTEKEICRTGEYYGSLAQIFSTYEKRMNLADNGNPIRGINSFQLFFKGGRWWIASITWQDETPGKQIPEKYVRPN